MENTRRQFGFSLIETMLAVATLAIGMVFVAGTFTAGVYFASVSTEGTIATVVTDAAAAKISLSGMNPDDSGLKTDGFVPYETVRAMDPREFEYPDSNACSPEYSWSAICRKSSEDSRLVKFTIFVSRLMGSGAMYWDRAGDGSLQATSTRPFVPRPVRVHVTVARTSDAAESELTIQDDSSTATADECLFLDAGFIIVDDATGQIYRGVELVKRDSQAVPRFARVTVTPAWPDTTTDAWVWVVPRPVAGGRSPLVAVYQKVIRL